MGKELLTLKLQPKEANVHHVVKKLKIPKEDIDLEFGVVNIDPKKGLYAILVEGKAARQAGKRREVKGPFSNPKIEAFGTPNEVEGKSMKDTQS